MSKQYYFHLGSEIRGPIPAEKVLLAVRKSVVTKEHLISYDGVHTFPAADIWDELAPPGTVIEPRPPQLSPQVETAGNMPTIKVAPPAPVEQEKPPGPWASIGWGTVFILVGIGLFLWLNHVETHGGTIRLPLWLMAIYAFLTKWGVLALISGLGLLGVFRGVQDLIAARK